MKILNFGSLNIDKVYKVPHFVRPGETISSLGYECFPGGKGLNQSIAVSRAGAEIWHAGTIGKDGLFLERNTGEERSEDLLSQRQRADYRPCADSGFRGRRELYHPF